MDYSKTNADYVIERLKSFSLEMPRGDVGQFKRILQEVLLLENSISNYKDILKKAIESSLD